MEFNTAFQTIISANISWLLRLTYISHTFQSKYCKTSVLFPSKYYFCFVYFRLIVKYYLSFYLIRVEQKQRRESKISNKRRLFPMRGINESQNKNIQTQMLYTLKRNISKYSAFYCCDHSLVYSRLLEKITNENRRFYCFL